MVDILIYFNADNAFRFSWCTGYDFESIKNAKFNISTKFTRLCYLTTDTYRMYLIYSRDLGYVWRPYLFSDNTWRVLDKHLWNIKDVSPDALSSEQSLREAIEFQMVLQWRNSLEGYYDTAPESSKILALLKTHPYMEALQEFRLTYCPADIQRDPEWSGAVEVFCTDGSIFIPFKEADSGEEKLLLKYATFVPDSIVDSIANKITGIIDSIISRFKNIHWSDIRFCVNKLWR